MTGWPSSLLMDGLNNMDCMSIEWIDWSINGYVIFHWLKIINTQMQKNNIKNTEKFYWKKKTEIPSNFSPLPLQTINLAPPTPCQLRVPPLKSLYFVSPPLHAHKNTFNPFIFFYIVVFWETPLYYKFCYHGRS